MVGGDPNTHKTLVCAIYDDIIVGAEHNCYLNKKQILKYKHRLNIFEVQTLEISLVQENIISGDGSDRLTLLLCAAITPVCPYAYICGYNGG